MSYNVMRIDELIKEVENVNCVGAWNKGVKKYALELLDFAIDYIDYIDDTNINDLESMLLNGANDWVEYSYSGNSLIFDYDIAKRLAGEGTLKATKNGELDPNGTETWVDVQARALYQAYNLIVEVYNDNIEYYGTSTSYWSL